MRFYARHILIALVCCGMLSLQAPVYGAAASPTTASKAAGLPPLAVIALADHAHVGNANASSGTTVYPGDLVDTAPGGELRLVAGTGQVYLLSESAAKLERQGSVLHASVVRGTVGFSGLPEQQLVMDTPEGAVHAGNGQPAYGQVTITGPKDMVVSAYTGGLVVERGDQRLVVNPGQAYYVSLVADPEPPQRRAGVVPALNEHLVWRLVIIGAAAGIGYWLWQHYSESPSDPK